MFLLFMEIIANFQNQGNPRSISIFFCFIKNASEFLMGLIKLIRL